MKSPGICEISMGGFEVFHELTRIPIAPITLLYGPNSAGKSAIEDAIRILAEVCRDPESPISPFEGTTDNSRDAQLDALSRVWRRTGDGPETRVGCLKLGAAILDNELPIKLLDEFSIIAPDFTIKYSALPVDGQHRLEIGVKFFAGSTIPKREIELALDGNPILSLSEGQEAAIHLCHPILQWLSEVPAFTEAAKSWPKRFSAVDGWLRVSGGTVLNRAKHLDLSNFAQDWIWEWDGEEEQDSIPQTSAFAGFAAFARVFDTLLRNAFAQFEDHLEHRLVSASRKVPTRSDLTFFFVSPSLVSAPYVPVSGESAYRRLAESFPCALDLVSGTEERYDELVNRMLSEYLFIDRGYQLSAICRLLAQPDRVGSFGREDRKSNSATTESDRWITLNLQDSSGRQLAFTEVGSGLGYVLPVLTAACDFALPVAVLQQPELHLHPALQSKIGDVFVELASCASLRLPRRRLIVETHSEHLLLRILRRVRQTTANLGNPELRVRPDDLCVVYFDPQINGTTTVNRLRVSADGDFIDRWPRGFFDERDEDLFDE